jgi:hypothetical protein
LSSPARNRYSCRRFLSGFDVGDLPAMRFDEYRKHDAVSLAELIAKREVSAKEVVEAAITRAEQVNTAINAIVHKQYEQARKAVVAGLPEGPLKGVPYLIKDLGFFETGEPATCLNNSRSTTCDGCAVRLRPVALGWYSHRLGRGARPNPKTGTYARGKQ